MPLLNTPPATTAIARSRHSGSSSRTPARSSRVYRPARRKQAKFASRANRAGIRRRVWPQQASDFGHEHEILTWLVAQNRAEPALRQSASIQGGGIEETDASSPGRLDDPMGLVIGDRFEEAAQRCGAQAER